ncbi:TetR/AcrR family transcriptional regulator [Gordonia sp. NPDC003376]
MSDDRDCSWRRAEPPGKNPEGHEGDPDTRARLLDAAVHIASTQGLDKVTYRSVAAQAGLSHSLVRFYFGSGDAMISQALALAAELDAEESNLRAGSIDEFGSHLLSVMGDERTRAMLQYDYLLRAVRGGIPLERVISVYDFYIDQVSTTLRNVGIDDEDGVIASTIFAAVDGMILQHAIYRSDERTEQMLGVIRRLLARLQDDPATDRLARREVNGSTATADRR